MNILIAGASGLVGQALVNTLKGKHHITVLGRSQKKLSKHFPTLLPLTWEELNQSNFDKIDVVINLCGANIGKKRWSKKRKQQIFSSRIETTKKLAEKCAQSQNPHIRLFNASAIGVYGLDQNQNTQNPFFDESSLLPAKPTDFLTEVGTAWEAATKPMTKAGKPIVFMRFGVVLSKNGGALAEMLPAFKCGLGGPIASGKQAFSWVSLHDLVRAVECLIENPEAHGAFNIVSPGCVNQAQFACTLSKALKRPCFFRMPSWLVKLLFGEMGDELLINGLHVRASRLHEMGFLFEDNTLDLAFKRLFQNKKNS